MSKKTKKILVGSVLVLIVLWGGLLRFWDLGSQSLWVDEAYTISASQAILAHGLPVFETGKVYTQGYIGNYLIAGMMKTFPFDPYDPWQTRVPTAIFGTLAIIALYFLVKEVLGDEWIALLTSFIFAFSYWAIAWSRQARGYSIAAFFILASLFYLWKFVRENVHKKIQWTNWKSVHNGVWATVLFLAALLSQTVAFLFFPAYVGVIAAMVFLSWRSHSLTSLSHVRLNRAAVFAASAFIVSVCAVAAAWALSIHTTDAEGLFLLTLWQVMPAFLIGGLIGTAIPLLVDLVQKRDLLPVTFLAIFWYVPLVFSTLYTTSLRQRYVFLAFPILITLGVLGISKAISYLLDKRVFPYVQIALTGAVVLLAIFSILSFRLQSQYYVGDSPEGDFSSAMKFIQSQWVPGDTVITYDATVSKVYLGDPGMQLSVGEIATWNWTALNTKNGIDAYTGAPIIGSYDDFENIVNTEHGFFYVDAEREDILGGAMYVLENDTDAQFVYRTSGPDPVSVYKF